MLPGPGAKVAPEGRPLTVSDVIGSPSGSAAVTFTVRRLFSATVTVAGTVTTGARSTLVTVMALVAEPESALLAVNVTLYCPAWEKLGVHVIVALVKPGPVVNVAPAGTPVGVSDVIGSPSGSAMVTLTVRDEFSATVTVAGAVTTGARSVLVTVMAVVPEPESALLAVNVTL